MNLLVVGVSYRSAPVAVLERLVVPAAQTPQVLNDLLAQEYIGEALVLSTCNRVEVYAGVSAFHGGLTDAGAVLARRAGCTPAELARTVTRPIKQANCRRIQSIPNDVGALHRRSSRPKIGVIRPAANRFRGSGHNRRARCTLRARVNRSAKSLGPASADVR